MAVASSPSAPPAGVPAPGWSVLVSFVFPASHPGTSPRTTSLASAVQFSMGAWAFRLPSSPPAPEPNRHISKLAAQEKESLSLQSHRAHLCTVSTTRPVKMQIEVQNKGFEDYHTWGSGPGHQWGPWGGHNVYELQCTHL